MQIAENPVGRDDLLVLTRASPSRAQKLLAFAVVPGILALVFIVSRPFAGVQLRAIEAFVPFYVTFIFLNSLITGILLFAQFSIYARARCWLSPAVTCSRRLSSFLTP